MATGTICTAVLRPVGTKAVDAALLLAKVLVPEPMRLGLTGSKKTWANVQNRPAGRRSPH